MSAVHGQLMGPLGDVEKNGTQLEMMGYTPVHSRKVALELAFGMVLW